MVINHLLTGMILQVQSPTDHHLHAIAFGEGEDLVEVRLIPRAAARCRWPCRRFFSAVWVPLRVGQLKHWCNEFVSGLRNLR